MRRLGPSPAEVCRNRAAKRHLAYSFSSSTSSSFALVATLSMSQVLVLRAPILVGVVQSSDWPFLDGPLGAAIILAGWLALVLGWRVGTKVAAACRRARRAAPGVGTRREATGPRGAEPTGCAWPRAAAVSTWSWSAAGSPFLTRPRFADGERTSLKWLLVEPANRFFRYRPVRVVDERETPGSSSFPIDGQHHLRRYADARQMLPQLCL